MTKIVKKTKNHCPRCLSSDLESYDSYGEYDKFQKYVSQCLNCGAKVEERYKKVYVNSIATFKEEDDYEKIEG
ncbi:hypothetical protein RyT2_05330 [Pseudolactococcus yaeyamensis]